MLIRTPNISDNFCFSETDNRNGHCVIPHFESITRKEPTYWAKQMVGTHTSPIPYRIDKITLTIPPEYINRNVFYRIKRMRSVNTRILGTGHGQIMIHEEAIDPNKTILESIWPNIVFLLMKGAFQFPVHLIPALIISSFGNLGDKRMSSFIFYILLMTNIRVTGIELALDIPLDYINMDIIDNLGLTRIEGNDGSWTLYNKRARGSRASNFVIYTRTKNIQKKAPDQLGAYDEGREYIRFEHRMAQDQVYNMLGHKGYLAALLPIGDHPHYFFSNWLNQPLGLFMETSAFKLREAIKRNILTGGENLSDLFYGFPEGSYYDWFVNYYAVGGAEFRHRMQVEWYERPERG